MQVSTASPPQRPAFIALEAGRMAGRPLGRECLSPHVCHSRISRADQRCYVEAYLRVCLNKKKECGVRDYAQEGFQVTERSLWRICLWWYGSGSHRSFGGPELSDWWKSEIHIHTTLLVAPGSSDLQVLTILSYRDLIDLEEVIKRGDRKGDFSKEFGVLAKQRWSGFIPSPLSLALSSLHAFICSFILSTNTTGYLLGSKHSSKC